MRANREEEEEERGAYLSARQAMQATVKIRHSSYTTRLLSLRQHSTGLRKSVLSLSVSTICGGGDGPGEENTIEESTTEHAKRREPEHEG